MGYGKKQMITTFKKLKIVRLCTSYISVNFLFAFVFECSFEVELFTSIDLIF